MIKLSQISFAQLRRFLIDLGFSEVPDKRGHRLEHSSSNTILLFRPYRPRDKVHMPDLVRIKSQLDWRGLVSADAFDDSLQTTSA
jgi:hypothetical protein